MTQPIPITPPQNQDQWTEFTSMQAKLHTVSLHLNQLDDRDEILKTAVIEARELLGFDRIGMLLHNEATDEIVGTWGVNERGDLSDEHKNHSPTKSSHWVEKVLKSHDYVALWEDTELKQWDKAVGTGWNAMAGMWDGKKCIGWVVCDNLISLQPLEPWRRIILGQFAKTLCALLVQNKQKQDLKFINENLENLVNQKSAQLRLKIEQLEMAKDDLVEAEKLASLGALVAGVAHEINTPVGVGITAASFLHEQTVNQINAYQNKTMKKSELATFFDHVEDSSNIILKNLNQAGELITSFKKIAVDQTHDVLDKIHLHQLVEDLTRSLRHVIKNRPITIINNIDTTLIFQSYAGRLNQIISNLINNSLLHGFEKEDAGNIIIEADLIDQVLCIKFYDTGKGVDEQALSSLFTPFYTTKRGKGGTGLGLNIIFNIISNMNGSIKASNNKQSHGLVFDITIKVENIKVDSLKVNNND